MANSICWPGLSTQLTLHQIQFNTLPLEYFHVFISPSNISPGHLHVREPRNGLDVEGGSSHQVGQSQPFLFAALEPTLSSSQAVYQPGVTWTGWGCIRLLLGPHPELSIVRKGQAFFPLSEDLSFWLYKGTCHRLRKSLGRVSHGRARV